MSLLNFQIGDRENIFLSQFFYFINVFCCRQYLFTNSSLNCTRILMVFAILPTYDQVEKESIRTLQTKPVIETHYNQILSHSLFRLSVFFQFQQQILANRLPFYPHFPFNIIFLMWYSYLLSSQKNDWKGQSNPLANFSFTQNQDIFYRHLLQNTQSLKQSCLTPIVLIGRKEQSELSCIKIEETNQKLKYYQKESISAKPTINEKEKIKKKIIRKSPEKFKKADKVVQQQTLKNKNPGRNSTSNIFRVFLKLCSKGKLENLIKNQFEKMSMTHSFHISYESFRNQLKQISPSTSNYVNMKEFKKIWLENSEFSRAFRCLFHWFSTSFAVNHSLTLRGKHKMMKESILHFLGSLHEIEQQLCYNEKIEQERIKSSGEQQNSKSTHTL